MAVGVLKARMVRGGETERKSSCQKWVKNLRSVRKETKKHSGQRRHAYVAGLNGGAGRDRTDDLLIANEALSQLSYSPTLPVEGTALNGHGRNSIPAAGAADYRDVVVAAQDRVCF